MNIFQHARFKIFNEGQHPLKHGVGSLSYTNARLPGISSLVGAIDYVFAFMYPNYVGTYANVAALPAVGAANDYAIVSDDGDGKSAGYVWIVLENTGQWMKRYDVDWSMEAILSETVNRTQYMYVQKFGMDDADATGTALTGVNSGQHIYGGATAGKHLTLHANSANSDTTGFVQFADNVRPQVHNTWDFGTNAIRWKDGYFQGTVRSGTLVMASGSITDTSGAISFNDENLSTTGSLASGTLAVTTSAVVANLTLTAGSIVSGSGALTFGAANVVTTGNVTGAIGYFTTRVEVGALAGNALLLAAGSITDESGAISFGAMNLTTTGTLAAGDSTFTRVDADNVRLDGNAISIQNTNGNLALSANGTGVIDLQSAVTSLGITATGAISATTTVTGGNVRLSGNTIITTNANGDLTLTPNGTGAVIVGKLLKPSADNTLDLGLAATRFNDLFMGGTISDGTNAITIADLLALRSTPYRDAGRTQAAQAGDTIFWSGTQWLASVPDTEIAHSSISGLTTGDAGHTQFVMLTGRAGGQVVQGGTAASETLVLQGTSHATTGTVQTKDPLVPFTNATYSAGWSGTDLGDATHYFRDVYTKGVHKCFRLESYTSGTLPSASASYAGRLVFSTDNKVVYVDTGGTWVLIGGGGGGGALVWVESDAHAAPVPSTDNGDRIYSFAAADTQQLFTLIRLPTNYVAGSPVKLRTTFYSADTSGTALIRGQSTLLRPGTDAMSATTNQRTTTNAAVTLSAGTNGKAQAIILDVTDTTGQINGVACSPGDYIRVRLYRDTDTATGDVKVPVYGTEVTFL